MAKSHGRSVGGIGRPRRFWQRKQRLNHPLHLLLVGSAPTADCLFDLIRRVLDDLGAERRPLGHRQTSSLGCSHRGPDVVLKEDPFDRNSVRSKLGDQRSELALKTCEPLGKGIRRSCTDHADGHCFGFAATGLDHAVATSRQTRVDSKNEHRFDTTR